MKAAKEKHSVSDDKPSPGTIMSEELRVRCNKLTDAQRQKNMVRAIRLVYGEKAASKRAHRR